MASPHYYGKHRIIAERNVATSYLRSKCIISPQAMLHLTGKKFYDIIIAPIDENPEDKMEERVDELMEEYFQTKDTLIRKQVLKRLLLDLPSDAKDFFLLH